MVNWFGVLRGVCSFVIPGLGQLFKRDYIKAIIFFIIFIILWFALKLIGSVMIQTIIRLLYMLFVAYDAYME